jgi:hypothetical protein
MLRKDYSLEKLISSKSSIGIRHLKEFIVLFMLLHPFHQAFLRMKIS